jgi:ADP-ribosylglycohydrolase
MSEREKIQELYDVIGSTLAIPDSVASAFGVLVMADGDPKQTAIYAAALSGDADTVGAMGCAIAGAWKGVEAFEQTIIDVLHKANPGYDFEKVAQGLLTLAQQ